MKKERSHEVIAAIKQLASDLGRPPSRDEFRDTTNLERAMKDSFGSYSVALHAAGFTDASFRGGGARQPREFKYKKSQLDGLHVHDYDLDTLFERAGNPEVLKIVFQPDTHIPNESPDALRIFIDFCKYYKPDVHIIGGDFLDCGPLSHWPADELKPRRMVPEALAGRKVLERIEDAEPTTTSRFYLEGNHEDWINQALVSKIPELADGLEQLGIDLSLKSILDLDRFKYVLLPMNHFLKIGKLYFTHGLYTGANHPKKHIDMLKASVVYGHLHDLAESNQTSLTGRIEAKSSGCLCRLDPRFMRGKPTSWAHAFTLVEMFRSGDFTRVTPTMMNGQLSLGGKVWK